MKTSLKKSHSARFNGMKAEKFGVLAVITHSMDLTQEEVARMLGIGRRTLQYWLIDDDYKKIEEEFKKSKEAGQPLRVSELENLVA